MPSPLNAALAAALAAGAVVAATAIGDTGDPTPAAAPRSKPVLIAPTRAQAIEAAEAFRTRVNSILAGRLNVTAERLLTAERAIVSRQLDQIVRRGLLAGAQRDALLKCFDDPKGCDRGGLPVLSGGLPPGGIPVTLAPEAVRPPTPMLRCARPPRRGARGRPARCMRRRLPAGPEVALARELGLRRADVGRALRGTARAIGRDRSVPRTSVNDPDGVPLGVPLLLAPFPALLPVPGGAFLESPPMPAPRPRRP